MVFSMAREQYRTADEDVAAEFERVSQLFRLALGKPSDRLLFDSLMTEASEQGLNWVQGLEYVIEKRRRGGNPAAESVAAKRRAWSEQTPETTDDLRRAG